MERVEHIEYLNFDLLIEPNGGAYKASVFGAPGGDASENFEMPFSPQDLETFLTCLGQPGQTAGQFEKDARDFGSSLFDAVFKDELYACLCTSRNETRNAGKGLRIRLRLGKVPELAALPWEYLYHRTLGGFLSRSFETPVVRYLDLLQPIRSLEIKQPLRVLVVISSPGDYPPLDVKREWANLCASFDELRRRKLVELDLLEKATESALQQHLWRKQYHVFHFIGHGGYDKDSGDGYLIMEDEENSGHQRLNGAGLAEHLQGRSFQLALLNACDGARASLIDPFGGTAQTLAEMAEIPAVIAMQFPITDKAAIDFAKVFYKAVADYCPVDTAMAEARRAIKESEWGTPALFMRSSDGRIFTKETSEASREESKSTADPDEVYYRRMIKEIKEGNLVPFIGAGANLCGRLLGDWQSGPYAPTDGELAAHLSGLRPLPDNSRDLVRVSQYIALQDTEVLSSELHDVFTGLFLATPLHRFLARLPRVLKDKGGAPRYQLIVTTNYDDVLERAFAEEGEPYDLVCFIASGDYSGKFYHKPCDDEPKIILEANQYNVSFEQRTVILKLHGAVDRRDPRQESYMITEDNYIDYLTRTDLLNALPINIADKLKSEDSKFLFLGYRLRDWNLRIIFRHIWGDAGPKSSSWALGLDADKVDNEFWNKRKVNILHNTDLKHYVEEMEQRL